jgi:hypothetical protein
MSYNGVLSFHDLPVTFLSSVTFSLYLRYRCSYIKLIIVNEKYSIYFSVVKLHMGREILLLESCVCYTYLYIFLKSRLG